MPLDGLDLEAFEATRRNAIAALLKERNEQGWWTGELSSSALSTATAIVAMTLAMRNGCDTAKSQVVQPLIDRGYEWLIANQNADGGWGDTDESKSNISTTMLVWGAMNLSLSAACGLATSADKCESWLTAAAGSLEIPALVEAVMKRYGKDRTFSVPILTMCALCGRLGPVEDRATWKWVKQLPFEFAALPRGLFKFLNLQVVSYALPALIAIGQVRHHFRPTRNPFARVARAATKKRTLRLLETIQPPNGGFLEATPLTSFVTMSIAACGLANSLVANRGIDFLIKSARPDGSWAIDTNLATWVTTLSVNALAAGGKLDEYLNESERGVIRDWLLGQQYKEVHPYTGAAPGGWAWTDLPGGVPDADDTSGAVLALVNLGEADERSRDAAARAMEWLMSLQNRDGGIPTFCRGWGKLSFDQSSDDITAHFVRAMSRHQLQRIADGSYPPATTIESLPPHARRTRAAWRAAVNFLLERKGADGHWIPLWFGNQDSHDDVNITYGTSRVLLADIPDRDGTWLLANQSDDGGWGGGKGTASSIEETALAVEALATALSVAKPQAAQGAVVRGVHWLIEHTARGTSFPPSPIGFYFAKLWYYEKLYPIIFTVAAQERVAALIESEASRDVSSRNPTDEESANDAGG